MSKGYGEMRSWQCLLVVLVISLIRLPEVRGSMGSCAKMVLFDSKTTRLYNQDEAKYITETKITFEMGLKETVCFKVLNSDGGVTDGEVDGKTFYLTFEDVQQIFTYKNSYEFAMPEIDAKCVCDCPGLEDHCSPKRDSCAEDKNKDKSCFKYYAPDQATDGCGLLSSIGQGEVCCSVSVKPWERDIYTAIEISTPATKARFRFEESKPYSSSQHNVDLDSAAKFFANKLTVSFANPGKSNPIPADWYYGNKNTNEVLTNVDINALDEWDLDKLGWYKYDEGSYNLDNTLVQRAFSGSVSNCDESSMDITFASKFNARKVEEAKPLSEYFKSSVEKAVRDDVNRNVYIEFRSFSRVSVMITIDGEKQVIQQFSMPSYLDYYGSVLLDKYSNRFINITIVSGRGTLYGTLVTKVEEDKKWVDKEVENFEVIVPSQEDVTKYNFTKYVLITSPCSPDSTAQLCIHTGSKNDQECKPVDCSEEPLEDFILADSSIDYTKGSKDSLLSPSTWLKYLNPMEWFNGITGMQEGVVMVVGIVGFIILLAILIKLCHCFNCVFRCFKCCFKLSCLRSCAPEDKYSPEESEEDIEAQEPPVPGPGTGLVMSNYHSNIKMYNITVMGDQIIHKNNARESVKIGGDFDYEDCAAKKGWHVDKSSKKSESSSFDDISPKKFESSSFDDISPKKFRSSCSIPKKCSDLDPPDYESSAGELSGEWDFERSFKKSISESSTESYFTANLGESFSKASIPETKQIAPERYLGVFEGTQINNWGDRGVESSSESVFPDMFLCLDSPTPTDSISNIPPNKLRLDSSPTNVFPDVFFESPTCSLSKIFPWP